MNFVWLLHTARVFVMCLGISMLSCTSIGSVDVWEAIESGSLSDMERLLKRGKDVNERRDSDNRLPLMHATLHQQPEVIEFLLVNGADVNRSDSVGNTCLLVASFLGAEETVNALLAGGADLFRRNVVGEDAFAVLQTNWRLTNYYANEIYQLGLSQQEIESGRAKVLPILLRAREQAAEEDIWVALALGRLDHVKSHLDRIDDISTVVTAEGSSILVAATALGQIEIVKYLLQVGADIESRDAFGATSLFVAAMFGYEEIAKVLLENNADIFVENYAGANLNTALELDWNFTNGIATLIGLVLDEATLNQTRSKIKSLIEAHKEGLEAKALEAQD